MADGDVGLGTGAEIERVPSARLPRVWIARTWAFYFAHRSSIVLGMAAYLAVIHVTAAYLFWHSPWPGLLAWKLGVGTYWVEFDQAYQKRKGQLSRLANSVGPGAALFIGDSLLGSLDVGALADRAVNLSIAGDTSRRVLRRIAKYAAVGKARLVAFHVGTNDLKYRSPEALGPYMTRVLDQIPSHVPVILSAVLPVDERVFELYGNAEVRAANRILERVCATRPGCKFVDGSKGLTDAGGGLDPRFHIDDGLHLNSEGNRIWLAALGPALAPGASFHR